MPFCQVLFVLHSDDSQQAAHKGWCVNMLVVKSDFDRLKAKGQLSELLQAEKLLSEGWVA